MKLPSLILLALVSVQAACSGDDQEPGAVQEAAAPALAGVASTTAFDNAAISCEKVIPADVAEAVNGWTLSEKQSCANCPRDCRYTSPESPANSLSISYDCRIQAGDAEIAAAKEVMAKNRMAEHPGLGKAAFIGRPMSSMTQISFWDDDTPCSINLAGMGSTSASLSDLAASVAAHTTAERLR